MLKRGAKKIIFLIFFLFIVNVFLAIVTNVSSQVTSSDIAIFRSVYGLDKPKQYLSFDQQVELIRKTQENVFAKIPLGDPIPEYQSREPEDLVNNQTGLCYDRSRTLDKIFTWFGLEARHVYILYLKHPITGENLSPLRAIFTYGTETHAVTEVRTEKGWMLVDSNSNWISLTQDGRPVRAGDVYQRKAEFDELPNVYSREFIAIPGMYSRRGQFYRPFIPYPELNWFDFLKGVISK